MKSALQFNFIILMMLIAISTGAQDKSIGPSLVITGTYHGETPPLSELPVMTPTEWQAMAEKAEQKILNPKIRTRSYPYAETALPEGPDPVWQKDPGGNREILNFPFVFEGQVSPFYPPDANGTVGPDHYMQTVNMVYAIYNKTGALLAGPTALNTLFSGVPGSECNNGDPIVLYDEQAGRWLVAEFSLCGANDYMLIAVSTTGDPTGTWHKYSFDVDDVPDYEKLGIWQDGYYMGTNNASGKDIYVFERSMMLLGLSAQAVGFDNPWRPTTTDGFMCVPPLDNDGPFAPAGEPGLFITINDDAIGGGTDQLWIYELDVDWANPENSTFALAQQLDVAAFDSNFGLNWDNIKQPGTFRELDAIPQVVMNPPQYRNFGTHETIVCCHTVDVDDTDHAGIRWYELRRIAGSEWTLRQLGTYAPDGHSRWMGSIMLNGQQEIALGYSISGSNIYPGIRISGQSAGAYNDASGVLDIPEGFVHAGEFSQTGANRWGDYSAMQVDPINDGTFWFTSMYLGNNDTKKTKIASFNFSTSALNADFFASNTNPPVNTAVGLVDISTGSRESWLWDISPETFVFTGGTSDSSPNPQVKFTAAGSYSITLTISNDTESDTIIKADYILAEDCGSLAFPFFEDFSEETLPSCWINSDKQGNGQVWRFDNPGSRVINTATASNGFAILDSDFYGPGEGQDADLISPSFNFHDYTSVILSFQHYYNHSTGTSATFSCSIDGGNTWITIQSWTASTSNAESFSQNLSAQIAGQENVKFKWNYTGSSGFWWAVDDIAITVSGPNIWTGTSSSLWSSGMNWSYGMVPTSADPVLIPATITTWPVFTGDLTIGSSCGDLAIESGGNLTVTGNVNIDPGHSLTFYGDGELEVGGNWINNGSFIPGQGNVNFSGTNPSIISSPYIVNDISQYERTTFPWNMTLLTGATTGPTGDNGYMDVPLGFLFNYIGVAYDQVRISTNGWITMNMSGTTNSVNSSLFTILVPNTTIAPWFDNLSDDNTSVVSYKTEGSAPSRVFIVQWHRVLTFNSQATARISFQVKLFETSNMIEFHYGNLESGSHSPNEGASIGIEDNIGGSGHFIEATTGSMITGITNLKSEFQWPGVNYRFLPSNAETFYLLSVSKSGAALEFNNDAVILGNMTLAPGAALNIKNGITVKILGNHGN